MSEKETKICPRCHGQGYIWKGEETADCPVCKGKGVLDK